MEFCELRKEGCSVLTLWLAFAERERPENEETVDENKHAYFFNLGSSKTLSFIAGIVIIAVTYVGFIFVPGSLICGVILIKSR